LERITYVTQTVNILNDVVSTLNTISANTAINTASSGNVTESKTYNLPEPYYYDIKLFTDNTQTITGLRLKTSDKTLPSKMILGISIAENDLLKGIMLSNPNFKNPRLVLFNLFKDLDKLSSLEGINYKKYKLGLVLEDTNEVLKLYFPIQDIIIYSIDDYYHFSKIYSDNMPSYELTQEVYLTFSSLTE